MITITDPKQLSFVCRSLKERVYYHTNTLPYVSAVTYTQTVSYEPYDLTYTSGSTQVIAEIKVREFESYRHKTGYIETQKLVSLLKLSQDMNRPDIHYLMYYTDGVVLVWNLRDFLHYPVTKKPLPETSANGKTKYVLKDVIELPVTQAMRFSYKIPSKQYLTEEFKKRFINSIK